MSQAAVAPGTPRVEAAVPLEERLLGQMLLIRAFEERVLALFDEGLLVGTTHCYIGQEANAVGILNHLRPTDIVWSSHRCHGHSLTFTQDVDGLLSELMGKATGTVGGRGGSQHLCRANFFSNGIQGGIAPAAIGMAFAEQYRRTGALVTVFLGDGTLGEGVVYESFNLASLWKLPVLFVIENNRYAQSTPVERQLAGSMSARPKAFGIETTELESFDAMEIYEVAGKILRDLRADGKPRVLILHTYRFCHHSKSDDHRDPKEVARWRAFDPIPLLARRVAPERVKALEEDARRHVQSAEEAARCAPVPGAP
ncbi:MAG: thiamine pyrophosphate-dependent dehydrogenase E1 component subunit alpha [Candidatus Omnitrophota bacterium]|nr:thiamine pyrophosphate-dependent dehydrogenase E1 component subunit alpha [Candidatus Omnitrophota bacterium]